jgi:hypothetical protein
MTLDNFLAYCQAKADALITNEDLMIARYTKVNLG